MNKRALNFCLAVILASFISGCSEKSSSEVQPDNNSFEEIRSDAEQSSTIGIDTSETANSSSNLEKPSGPAASFTDGQTVYVTASSLNGRSAPNGR